MLEGETDVRSSIEIILSTQLGERVMRPGFGWQRDAWLFESLTTTALTIMRRDIEKALLLFEPRIDVLKVELLPDITEGKVNIQVDYKVRTTNSRGNLVFPFYLIEANNIT